MLTIHIIGGDEYFDEEINQFIYVNDTTLQLEHSLLSLKKWEAKWCVPFLDGKTKTWEQTIDYIRCMTITQNVNPIVYRALNAFHLRLINDYIDAPMTATWFAEDRKPQSNRRLPNQEIITAERIYYWKVAYHIPFECQKWHLNQLITLIRVCNEEYAPKKELKGKDLYKRNRELNAARKAKLNTKG